MNKRLITNYALEKGKINNQMWKKINLKNKMKKKKQDIEKK